MEAPSKKPRHFSDPNPAAGRRDFPPDLIFNILSRLPVKSIIRLACVCEHWRTLTSEEDFKSEHLSRSPSSIFIHYNNDLYTCAPPNQPSVAGFPDGLIVDPIELDIIGSTQKGIVCLSLDNDGERIALWNPATRSTRTIPSPTITYNRRKHNGFSVGIGYDPTRNNIVIVRIISPAWYLGVPDAAEIYSLNHGQWQTVEFADIPPFNVCHERCDAVINGVPYWESFARGAGGRKVMVSFNPVTMSFDVDPLAEVMPPTGWMCYGEIRGCLAVVAWKEKYSPVVENQFLDIWIRDNDTRMWSKFRRVGPMNYIGTRVWTYGETGILQEIKDGEEDVFFYAFDFESHVNGKKLELPKSVVPWICDVVRYKESLYSIP